MSYRTLAAVEVTHAFRCAFCDKVESKTYAYTAGSEILTPSVPRWEGSPKAIRAKFFHSSSGERYIVLDKEETCAEDKEPCGCHPTASANPAASAAPFTLQSAPEAKPAGLNPFDPDAKRTAIR